MATRKGFSIGENAAKAFTRGFKDALGHKDKPRDEQEKAVQKRKKKQER